VARLPAPVALVIRKITGKQMIHLVFFTRSEGDVEVPGSSIESRRAGDASVSIGIAEPLLEG